MYRYRLLILLSESGLTFNMLVFCDIVSDIPIDLAAAVSADEDQLTFTDCDSDVFSWTRFHIRGRSNAWGILHGETPRSQERGEREDDDDGGGGGPAHCERPTSAAALGIS